MSYPNNASFVRDSLAKIVAASLEANPLAGMVLKNSVKWVGESYKQPIKFQKNQTFQTYTGLDALSTNRSETTVNMEFDMKNASMAIALGNDELSKSQSDTSVTDKLRFKMEEAQVDLAEELGSIFYGSGAGSDFNGLENIVDDGTTAATIGGLARATYSVLNSNLTASGGTLTVAQMVAMHNAISDAGLQPDAIFCDRTVNALYEKLAQTLNQYTALKPGQYTYNTGAQKLTFKGIPVHIDPKATAQTMYFLNSKMLKFARGMAVTSAKEEAVGSKITQMEGVPEGNMANLGFVWSGFKRPSNQNAVVGHLTLRGELIPKDPGRLGKITGITTS